MAMVARAKVFGEISAVVDATAGAHEKKYGGVGPNRSKKTVEKDEDRWKGSMA
jgi:hypothetical protein